MYPDDFFAALGEEYERFVGVYFERVRHCTVIYQGRMLGKADGGIDLIAISPDTTYLIQCKNWSSRSEIHEDVVNQLSGSSRVFSHQHPTAKNVVPVVVATCRFASDAQLSAQVNKVDLLNISYSKGTANGETVLFNRETTTQGYVSPLYTLELMPRYGSFVDDKIALIQYPTPAQPEPSEPSQTPEPSTTQSKNHKSFSPPLWISFVWYLLKDLGMKLLYTLYFIFVPTIFFLVLWLTKYEDVVLRSISVICHSFAVLRVIIWFKEPEKRPYPELWTRAIHIIACCSPIMIYLIATKIQSDFPSWLSIIDSFLGGFLVCIPVILFIGEPLAFFLNQIRKLERKITR